MAPNDDHHENQVELPKVSVELEEEPLSYTSEDFIEDNTRDSTPLANNNESEDESLSLAPNLEFPHQEDQAEDRGQSEYLSPSSGNFQTEVGTEAQVEDSTPNVNETSITYFDITPVHDTDDESLPVAPNKESKEEYVAKVEDAYHKESSEEKSKQEEESSISSKSSICIEEERLFVSQASEIESSRVAKKIKMKTQNGQVTSLNGKDEELKPAPPEPEMLAITGSSIQEQSPAIDNSVANVDLEDVTESEMNLEKEFKKFPEKVIGIKNLEPEVIRSMPEIMEVDLPIQKFDPREKLSDKISSPKVEGEKKAEMQRVYDRSSPPKSVSPSSKLEDSIQLGNNNSNNNNSRDSSPVRERSCSPNRCQFH